MITRRNFFGSSAAAIAIGAGFVPLKELPSDYPLNDGTEYSVHILIDDWSDSKIEAADRRALFALQQKKINLKTLKKFVVQRVDLSGKPYELMYYGRTI